MKQLLLPKKIIEYKGVANPKSLFTKQPPYATIAKELDQYFKMEGEGSYIVLDFGKEMNGGVRIISDFSGRVGCKIRIRFGESYGEVNSDIGYKNSVNAHSPRDFEALICSYGDIVLGQTGFRFVRIDVLSNQCAFIKNIYCENNILNKKTIYTYDGEDKNISKIFKTAKRTVDLCSATGVIWDGIKRDRILWIGDLAPEVMALSTMYGRTKEVEKSIDLGAELFPLPKYMNNMFTYSLWWLYIVGTYYDEFSCKDYVSKHIEYIASLIAQLDEVIDKEGNLPADVRALVDWPSVDSLDEPVGRICILLLALNNVVNIFNDFNLDKTHLNSLIDKANKKDLTVKKMKQIIGLKYAATGQISDEEYKILIEGGAKGFSTFMSYFILTAIASRDEKLAIKLMKEYYLGMINRGATTFFEDFDIEWLNNSGRIDEKPPEGLLDLHGDFGKHCYVGFRHSLCHGWSAGVIKFIKEHCK